eukprot:TRINITY_DN216_c1_g1_i1.p1 TRINITY_DN216_c1_g1~~TRINITY_DN216_c1_g1_i1.p1  ORF type:complete len:213 (+),score=45.38 TRINITY_DN216_c1_g1_i1:445-1083(+)
MGDDNFNFLFKVVVTGDSTVGKTNIITRFTTNTFTLANKATIGVDFGHAEVTVADNTSVKVQIWDTAGQERFRAINRGFYHKAAGAMVVYDITQAETFKNAEKWLTELRQYAGDDVVVMLVGNKTDLSPSRAVATEDAKKFAQQHGLLFLETSALAGDKINQAFQETIEAIYEKNAEGRKHDPSPRPTIDPTVQRIIVGGLEPPEPKPSCRC